LNRIKKLYFLLKNRTFDPHAAKAQIKKLWYLKDQGTVEMTSPPEHQKDLQMVTTSLKDQALQDRENPLQQANSKKIIIAAMQVPDKKVPHHP
jgi:hypothetical protein